MHALRARRTVTATVSALVVLLAGSSLTATWAGPGGGNGRPGRMEEIGTLPIFEPGPAGRRVAMVLDPTARRGYQISTTGPGGDWVASPLDDTVIWSFELDTLAPVRRTVIEDFGPTRIGALVTAGNDVAHAVDETTGMLYLGGVRPGPGGVGAQTTVAVLDEARLEQGAAGAVRFLDTPTAQLAQLTGRSVYGMALHRVAGRAKLVLFAATDTQKLFDDPVPQDPYLVQWDAATGAPDWTSNAGLLPGVGLGDNGVYRIQSCQDAPVVTNLSEWVHALGILVHPSGIYLACQSQRLFGHTMLAVQVALDAAGRPSGDRGFPGSRQYANVLADQAGGRLLFEVYNLPGIAWMPFDAATQSYDGAALSLSTASFIAAAGLDPRSGRLYALIPIHMTDVVLEGGFQFTDSRLSPIPAFTNIRPDMAYPAQSPILVDPSVPGKKRHVFVRKGTPTQSSSMEYPHEYPKIPAPIEDFYRVLRDTVPLPE